jgi:hypothetical protein
MIEPTLEQVEFDTVGLKFHSETNRVLKVWTNPEADVVTLNLFLTAPDIRVSLANLEGLREMYREQVTAAKGGLIEVGTLEVSSIPSIKTILKLPQKMAGVAYVAAITIPFKDFSFVLKITCQERGFGGTREIRILEQRRLALLEKGETRDVMIGWNSDPYDPNFKSELLMTFAENQVFDADFPDHPISRARFWIEKFEKSLKLEKSLVAFEPFERRKKKLFGLF